ncbi:MAG TPA: amino acid ABC transporter substrate-binding protein [Stellaceae bacterium]|jgi:branched-chain amino acid transport system substrate-binding protein|nr:amino acid ABC transporter substrate-binding protein [Stellaceae bacterium]
MNFSGITKSAFAAAALIALALPPARAADPIKIGFSMEETGGLAANGKQALIAMQIWAEDVNAKGGLLGRPVELVHYDDQSNPANVPQIYTKLLDVDKVDLVVGSYATGLIAPAMPIVMQHNKVFIGLLGLGVNTDFQYPKYFSMLPAGPNPKTAFAEGFFNIAKEQNPKPKTMAIVSADIEFAHNAADGARALAKADGFQVVYDKTYPGNITDCTPVVRAIQAANPDVVVVASYITDSVCMTRAVKEVGFKPKMIGAAMVGPQSTPIKQQLGAALNGFIAFDIWQPAKTMLFPGVEDVLKKYQARAKEVGADPLGYYMVPVSYADLQILQQAVEATKSLDQDKLAEYMHATTFHTVFGDIKFGKDGEWEKGRMLMVQFQGITGNDVDQFKDPAHTVILDPPALKSGNVAYPFTGG